MRDYTVKLNVKDSVLDDYATVRSFTIPARDAEDALNQAKSITYQGGGYITGVAGITAQSQAAPDSADMLDFAADRILRSSSVPESEAVQEARRLRTMAEADRLEKSTREADARRRESQRVQMNSDEALSVAIGSIAIAGVVGLISWMMKD